MISDIFLVFFAGLPKIAHLRAKPLLGKEGGLPQQQ